jgi:2-polyprenyl-3-methyl-5-hydroxy-6-metoxy-1,4-benzoquinol methylase
MDLDLLKRKNFEFWEARFENPELECRKLIERNWSPLIQRLKDNEVRDVLDLGCGYGQWSIALARAGFSLQAVDCARSAVELLRKWSVDEGLAIHCEVNTIQAINFTSEFDAVICNSVLDHMTQDDTRLAMRNIKQALRPNGIAYISFDGPEKAATSYTLLDDGTRCYGAGEFNNMLWRYYTDAEIGNLCENFSIMQFSTRGNGKRDVWIKKL